MTDQSIAWRPISTAPVDKCVLLATTGEWVGEAVYGENEDAPAWRWADGKTPIHADLKPLGWMPLPPPINEPV